MYHSILLRDGHFRVEHSSLTKYKDSPLHQRGGMIMLCRSGRALITVNLNEYRIEQGCEIILIPDSIFVLVEASNDFAVDFVAFSEAVFNEIVFKLDPNFISHLWYQPIYRHTALTLEVSDAILRLIFKVCNDVENAYRQLIATNYLRNMMLTIYDAIQRDSLSSKRMSYTRKEELLHRFLRLVDSNVCQHRDVAFYTESLCVSKSYLTSITRSIINKSPKEIIDERVVQEIKIMLDLSDCTIQQIADKLHFPDQSYLGRYFKHHTGKSPLAYRHSLSEMQ